MPLFRPPSSAAGARGAFQRSATRNSGRVDVRIASGGDFPEIWHFCETATADACMGHLAVWSETQLQTTLSTTVAEGGAFIARVDGELVGLLLGVLVPPTYLRARFAIGLALLTVPNPTSTPTEAPLVERFEAWARSAGAPLTAITVSAKEGPSPRKALLKMGYSVDGISTSKQAETMNTDDNTTAERIRPATHSDIETLLRFGKHLHSESPHYRSLPFDKAAASEFLECAISGTDRRYRQMPNVPACALVVERKGTVVGVIVGSMVPLWNSAREIIFYVDPNHRNSRVGTALIRAFGQWARDKGACDVEMGVSTGIHTEQTVQFYERMGFRRTTLQMVKRLHD